MGAQCVKALNVHFMHFQLLWNKDLVVPINIPPQRPPSSRADPAPPLRGRTTDDLVLEDMEVEGGDTNTPSHQENSNPQLEGEGAKPKDPQPVEKKAKRKRRRRQRRHRGRRLPVEPLQVSKPQPLPPIQAVGKKNKVVPATLSQPSSSHAAARQAWTEEMVVEDIEWEDRDLLILPPVRPPIRVLVQNKTLIGSEAEYLDAQYLNIPCYDEGYNPLSDGEDMEELERKVKEKRRKREERLQRRRLTAEQIEQLLTSHSNSTPAMETCASEKNTEKKTGSKKFSFKKFWQRRVNKQGTKA